MTRPHARWPPPQPAVDPDPPPAWPAPLTTQQRWRSCMTLTSCRPQCVRMCLRP
jgi:hypothetical protein